QGTHASGTCSLRELFVLALPVPAHALSKLTPANGGCLASATDVPNAGFKQWLVISRFERERCLYHQFTRIAQVVARAASSAHPSGWNSRSGISLRGNNLRESRPPNRM